MLASRPSIPTESSRLPVRSSVTMLLIHPSTPQCLCGHHHSLLGLQSVVQWKEERKCNTAKPNPKWTTAI